MYLARLEVLFIHRVVIALIDLSVSGVNQL